MDVLDFALQVGKWAEQHYRRLASDAAVPGVRDVFAMMASDHGTMSQQFQRVSKQAGEPLASPALDRAERPLCRVFSRLPDSQLPNRLAAYRYGLRLEWRLAKLLTRLAKRQRPEVVKVLLNALAEEELGLYRNMRGLCEFSKEKHWYPSAIEYAMEMDRAFDSAGN